MATKFAPKMAPAASTDIAAAADAAIRSIAPLWPLRHFVAVNPFLGFSGQPFAEAAQRMASGMGARMTMDRRFYGDAVRSARITDTDLEEAIADTPAGPGIPRTAAEARLRSIGPSPAKAPLLPLVADVVALHGGTDWPAILVQHQGAFAARQFDEGEAAWASPHRERGVWATYRQEARHDLSLALHGLKGARANITALPEDAPAAIARATAALGLDGLPEASLAAWYHRLLAGIGGWAGHARYRLWQAELYGKTDTALLDLLAVRLAGELALLASLTPGTPAMTAWLKARDQLATPPEAQPDIAFDCLLQLAYEKGWQREFRARLEHAPAAPARLTKAVQAAFCIDVRSEVFRRALESQSPTIETIGFAGFFGFSLEYLPLGQSTGGARCPVLLTPGITIAETVSGADAAETAGILARTRISRRTAEALGAFKRAAVSSFAYVETLGLTYGAKLVSDSLGFTRPVPHPNADGLDAGTVARLSPQIAAGEVAGRETGLTAEAMEGAAAAVLGAMSMTKDFGRLVMLAGHGSTSVNNPHATGLDCGACGGHDGEANARVAADILNQPHVRTSLAAKGIHVPAETWFIGALHDTTTDEVHLFDEARVPAALSEDLAQLKRWLAAAGREARTERALLLHLNPGAGIDGQIEQRARDWSQVRPEWGLAGCAAFVAAPRHRTQGIDLGGRSFLHNYDWEPDSKGGYGVLELIMTAPMVVASWISLQYYGSSVDNVAFGSGNKVLHNAVGALGVLEGNGGDLRTGLPLQSVHDGERLIHEPLRLSVVIEAPMEAMDAVIAKHAGVHDLLRNQWLHLFAIQPDGSTRRWAAAGTWK